MKKIALPLLLTSLLMATAPTSFADQQQGYGSQVANKALNGFANMTTSVLEIPKNIINTTNESHIIYGLSGGIAKGVLHTVGRMATGLTDLITAPIPTKPIAYPEYVWDDFDEDTTYGKIFRLQD